MQELRRVFGEAKTAGRLSALHLETLDSSSLYTTQSPTMASPSICHRCALRIQRTVDHTLSKRAFSTTSSTRRGIPSFAESTNPELNHALATLREKHFIPSYLRPREQHLIFGDKNRQNLIDNPQSVAIAEEEIPLHWIDRKQEIPDRQKLVTEAINLILNGEAKEWQNLPSLMQGLKDGAKKPLSDALMEKIVRRAVQKGKLGHALLCLQQASRTGMTLKNERVLRWVVHGLRTVPQEAGWDKEVLEKAVRNASAVADMLESEEHGSGHVMSENDPRARLEVLGPWLELVAVYAYKFQDKKDSREGTVKRYAERMVSRLEETKSKKVRATALQTVLHRRLTLIIIEPRNHSSRKGPAMAPPASHPHLARPVRCEAGPRKLHAQPEPRRQCPGQVRRCD
jgi:hypothetical protein